MVMFKLEGIHSLFRFLMLFWGCHWTVCDISMNNTLFLHADQGAMQERHTSISSWQSMAGIIRRKEAFTGQCRSF